MFTLKSSTFCELLVGIYEKMPLWAEVMLTHIFTWLSDTTAFESQTGERLKNKQQA